MIRIGPAGTSGIGYEEGIKKANKMGLKCLEVEYTYGVHMNNMQAKEIGKLAKENDIQLSVHAPYFINLNTEDPKKLEASKKRIIDSCERGYYLGAKKIVFHAGFYLKNTKEEGFNNVKTNLIDLKEKVLPEWKTELSLETTGKMSQIGDLNEILKLRKEIGTGLCIDFAHILARTQKLDMDQVLTQIKKEGIKEFHGHYSGIEYSEKGERKHLLTEEKFIRQIFSKINEYKLDCTLINESPDPWGDCEKSMKVLKEIEKK